MRERERERERRRGIRSSLSHQRFTTVSCRVRGVCSLCLWKVRWTQHMQIDYSNSPHFSTYGDTCLRSIRCNSPGKSRQYWVKKPGPVRNATSSASSAYRPASSLPSPLLLPSPSPPPSALLGCGSPCKASHGARFRSIRPKNGWRGVEPRSALLMIPGDSSAANAKFRGVETVEEVEEVDAEDGVAFTA